MAGADDEGNQDAVAGGADLKQLLRGDGVVALGQLARTHQAKLGRGGRTDQGDVVPHHGGDRRGHFLQPGGVGLGAVAQLGAGLEHDLEIQTDARGRRGVGGGGLGAHGDVLGSGSRAGQQAVVQHLAPGLVEVAGEAGLPRFLHHFVDGGVGLAVEHRQDVRHALALVQGLDQRLDDGKGAVKRGGVAPGFQRVGHRHMPVALLAGFIGVNAEVNAGRSLGKHRGEIEIARGRVDGVQSENEDGLDRTGLQALGHRLQRSDRAVGLEHRGDQANGRANGTELGVDRMGQRVNGGRLGLAHHHQGLGPGTLKVAGDGVHKEGLVGVEVLGFHLGLNAQLGGDGGQQNADPRGANPETVVGGKTGGGEGRLEHVKSVHRRGLVRQIGVHDGATGEEIGGVANRRGGTGQEIVIQRKDRVGLVQGIDAFQHLAKRKFSAGSGVVQPRGIDAEKFCGGIVALQLVHQALQSRRGVRGHQDRHAIPGSAGGGNRLRYRSREGTPIADAALVQDEAGAVRIVEVENGGLRRPVGAAQAGRVGGIAFHLGRTAHVALGQHADRVTVTQQGGCVEQRLAGNDFLRGVHVGDNSFGWLLGAGGQTGHGDRGAQGLEEAAAGDRLNKGVAGVRFGGGGSRCGGAKVVFDAGEGVARRAGVGLEHAPHLDEVHAVRAVLGLGGAH